MKTKFLIFIVGLFLSIHSLAIDYNDYFAFKKQNSLEGYQQYIGQLFYVREAVGEFETWEKTGFSPSKSNLEKIYKILNVSLKDVVVDDEQNKEITFEAVENDGKKKIKFICYENLTERHNLFRSSRYWPSVDWMPIVFTEPLEAFKKENVGNIISNAIVKDQYEIIDAMVGKSQKKTINYTSTLPAVILLKVKNTRTGIEKIVDYSERSIMPFLDDAFDGEYDTYLYKVEKPENTNERFGDIIVVEEEGINKFSFNDSIIDIIIFTTKQQFDFVLKNVSNHSIKIIWNEASFVDIDGSSSKVMHSGTRYINRESDQPATTIIKGAKLDDIAVPNENLSYNDILGWTTKRLLPQTYLGKEPGEIKLMLPIQINEVVNEYTFIFKLIYNYKHPELLKNDSDTID